MTTTTQRTRAEIDDLMGQWRHDPCWDIEETEGFGAHRDELLAYRLGTEQAWAAREHDRLAARAVALNTTNLELVRYLERMEARIKGLEQIVDRYEQGR